MWMVGTVLAIKQWRRSHGKVLTPFTHVASISTGAARSDKYERKRRGKVVRVLN